MRSLSKKTLFIFISILSVIGYGFVVFANPPSGGYTPGTTLNPSCAPGETDCVVTLPAGGSSQWDDVVGGINYAGGNVGIGDSTPNSRLSIKGQNPNNYVFLLGGDSSETQNNFGIHLQDNGPDQFGVIDMYASPEESFILSAQKLDGSYSGSFRLSTQGITNISSSDDIGNSNNIEINPLATVFNNTNSFENFLFQLYPNVARFIPSTNSRGGVAIGNLGMISADEAGLYDAGGDIPLAVFDATSVRAYYTQQMFVDYNSSYISLADTHNGGGISVNFADGSINIGKAETNAADGIEGIQVYQNGNNPVVKVGSSAFIGNGTLFTVNDLDQQFTMDNGNLYLQNGGDGIALAENYLSQFRSGIYSRNGDQVIADYDSQNNLYTYGNGMIIADGANSHINLSSQCINLGQGNVGTIYVSDDCFGGDIGLRNGINDEELAVYIPNVDTYRYGGSSLLAYMDSDGGFGGDVVSGINLDQDFSYINFAGNPSGAIGSQGYGFRDNNGVMEFKDIGGSWTAFSSLGGGGSSPITVVNTTNLFSTGLTGTGQGVTATNGSIFLGINAGKNATGADRSNFIGQGAGFNSTDADSSNFFGLNSGNGATDAFSSNFFGPAAGATAINAHDSNFFGSEAGSEATDAYYSNFFGYNAGYQATNARNSNFFGLAAGSTATDAAHSNFFGEASGGGATGANNSNFLGTYAGNAATNAAYGNFFGANAGRNAIGAANSNFFGQGAGQSATNAQNSNFFGPSAGRNATNAEYSNFFGVGAGYNATNADSSVFIGTNAGYNATGAYYSTFIGGSSGYAATGAAGSIFIGANSGYAATSANDSNFFGPQAGYAATNAEYSNFFGRDAGTGAENAINSNFFGKSTGADAINATNSNFIGMNAGLSATNAEYSNFFGRDAGSGATNARNSIFIGNSAGQGDTVNNTTTDDFSILIGKSTSTGGFKNSIAIGGSATNTASNQFMIGSTTRPINELVIKGSGTCSIAATGLSCSSDERLKTNIEDLSTTTLEDLLKVRTVLYNWNSNPTGDKVIGFLAQDLEQYYPQLVRTDADGFKMVNYAQMTPILVESIRELNLKVMNIQNLTPGSPEATTFFVSLAGWLGDAGNGIRSLVVHDKICVDDQCLTKDDIKALLEMKNNGPTTIQQIPVTPEQDPIPDPDDNIGDLGDQTSTPSADTPTSGSDENSPSDSSGSTPLE